MGLPCTCQPGYRGQSRFLGSIALAVREVQFYRVDIGGNTLLGRDTSSPYALEPAQPAGAAGEVRFLARAVDDAGQAGESQVVVVTVR